MKYFANEFASFLKLFFTLGLFVAAFYFYGDFRVSSYVILIVSYLLFIIALSALSAQSMHYIEVNDNELVIKNLIRFWVYTRYSMKDINSITLKHGGMGSSNYIEITTNHQMDKWHCLVDESGWNNFEEFLKSNNIQVSDKSKPEVLEEYLWRQRKSSYWAHAFNVIQPSAPLRFPKGNLHTL